MKKNKVPLLLKIVRWLYPRLEKIFPRIAYRFFVFIFFTPIRYRIPDKERLLAKESEKFSFKVKGRRIQCYSWGTGPLVLVVHGWAGRATQFRKIIYALVAAGYRVVGFDGPAHGASEGRSTDILAFEEVLWKLSEVAGIPEAVIAHSFGGAAVLLAMSHGWQVNKVINIASPTIGDEIINTYRRAVGASPATADYLKSYVVKTTGKPFDHFTALHFIENIPPDVHLLLIHDQHDDEVPLVHALELQKKYPAAVLFRTAGLGHTRILKDEAVIKKCVSFLRS